MPVGRSKRELASCLMKGVAVDCCFHSLFVKMPFRVSNIRPSLAGGRRKSRASHAAAIRRVSHLRSSRVSNGGVLNGKVSEAPGLSISPGDSQQEDGGCCGSVGSRRESAIIVSIVGWRVRRTSVFGVGVGVAQPGPGISFFRFRNSFPLLQKIRLSFLWGGFFRLCWRRCRMRRTSWRRLVAACSGR